MKSAVSRSLATMRVLVPLFVSTAGLVLVAGCCAITCPSPCSPESSHEGQSRTATLSDGRVLARFDFRQTVTVGLGDCPATDRPTGTISLSITNMTAETVSFGYTVTDYGEKGAIVWTYSGRVTLLAAGATVDVGVIVNSVVPLVLGVGPRVEVTAVSAS